MRLIDADSFIQHLHEPMKYGYSLIDHVKNEPTVPTFGQWISVEDVCPERDKVVLVHVVGHDWDEPDAYISIDSLNPEGLWRCHHLSVTHWMPMPEPPTEE